MKIRKIIISLLAIVLCFSACKKKSNDTQNTSTTTIFSSEFESQSDLSLWSQSSGGNASIDGNAVKFDNITSCFVFETVNLIPVQAGKTYELKVTGKVNSSVSGDPALCVGDFMIYVIQGSTNLISEGFGNYPDWTKKSYSFTPASGTSVKLRFLIGTTRGAWIDKIELDQD